LLESILTSGSRGHVACSATILRLVNQTFQEEETFFFSFIQMSDQVTSSEFELYGYEIAHLTEINPRYRCIFCLLIINNPIQLTECGHRSCRDCFEIRANRTADGNVTCPVEDCQLITNKNEVIEQRKYCQKKNNKSDFRLCLTGHFVENSITFRLHANIKQTEIAIGRVC